MAKAETTMLAESHYSSSLVFARTSLNQGFLQECQFATCQHPTVRHLELFQSHAAQHQTFLQTFVSWHTSCLRLQMSPQGLLLRRQCIHCYQSHWQSEALHPLPYHILLTSWRVNVCCDWWIWRNVGFCEGDIATRKYSRGFNLEKYVWGPLSQEGCSCCLDCLSDAQSWVQWSIIYLLNETRVPMEASVAINKGSLSLRWRSAQAGHADS